ncbi:unnamed protein product [Colias eurytheme]|nr:unnamed protein product [Colias eurytheme]
MNGICRVDCLELSTFATTMDNDFLQLQITIAADEQALVIGVLVASRRSRNSARNASEVKFVALAVSDDTALVDATPPFAIDFLQR